MAKPIKETPVLKGKDAKKFLTTLSQVQDNRISSTQIAKMKENFSRLDSIVKR
jgi:hypothetical protein